jgi:hypothetical protein
MNHLRVGEGITGIGNKVPDLCQLLFQNGSCNRDGAAASP